MSYDLTIFFAENPAGMLADLIAAEPDLTVEFEGEELVVKRGSGLYCCSIGAPVRMEPDDLPDEVLSPDTPLSFQVDVLVEGSAPAAITRTRKLVRHIVRSFDGISWDRQKGTVDPRSAQRRAAPTPKAPVDLVELDWYAPRHDGVAQTYLHAVHRHFPDAGPRRFGSYEPLQYRLDRDGPERFIQEEANGTMLHFTATAAVSDGWIGSDRERGTRVSLHVLADSLHVEATRLAVRALFIDLARQLDCFFASAQVIRNVSVAGWPLPEGLERDAKYAAFWREGWMGLPPHPVWWAYFGSRYAQFIDSASSGLTHYGDFAVMELATYPTDREALAARLPRRGLLRRRAPWVRSELQMTPLETASGYSPPKAERAPVVPRELGVPTAPPGYRI